MLKGKRAVVESWKSAEEENRARSVDDLPLVEKATDAASSNLPSTQVELLRTVNNSDPDAEEKLMAAGIRTIEDLNVSNICPCGPRNQ